MKESDIRKEIRDWLDSQGIFCWPNMTTGIPDGKGGFWKHPMPGISDISAVLPGGRFIAIECKAPGHKTDSDRLMSQAKFLSRVNSCGGLGFMAYSLQDVKNKIEPLLDQVEPGKRERASQWFKEAKVIMEATRIIKPHRRGSPKSAF